MVIESNNYSTQDDNTDHNKTQVVRKRNINNHFDNG